MVALLLSMDSFCERHRDRDTAVGTDVTCTWDKPRKESKPVPFADLNLGKANIKVKLKSACPDFPHSTSEVQKTLNSLLHGKAAVSPFISEIFVHAENTTTVPTMEELAKEYIAIGTDQDFEEYITNTFKVQGSLASVEESTRGQSNNTSWFHHREGRITASIAHKVSHYRHTHNKENYITDQIMNHKSFTSKYTNHGIINEPVAIQMYKDQSLTNHKKIHFKECGLFLDATYPFLGASPDLLVSCSCCGDGLAEIKCPFTFRNASPMEIPHVLKHFNVSSDGEVRLSETSPWYSQIQMQMAIKACKYCDLVVYTEVAPYIYVNRIFYDEIFYDELKQKLLYFYRRYVTPLLIKEF